jgi:fatty-acyl-CoA synthase
LAREAMARGIDIFGGYGMSETCPVLTLAQLTPDWLEADSEQQLFIRCMAGRTIPFVAIRVVDSNFNELPWDGKQQGEVVARAPWLAEAYLHDFESTKRLWRNGWLHTGDVGYITADGYLKITDRIKDVIKSGGEWISSLEIEELLLRHPAVAEAAVFGIPDDKWGERPVGVVVLQPGKSVNEAALLDILRDCVNRGELSRYGILSKLAFAPSLPKTSVGKLDKKRLREEFLHPAET